MTGSETAAKPPAKPEPKPKAEPKPEPELVVWPSLAAALVAAQGEMEPVAKDQENPHYKSKFVSLDKLIEKTRPVLLKHGLAVTQLPCVSELGAPMLRTTVIHAGTGERLEADMPLFVSNQNMQQLGSAITYARRYAWAAVLGVASEEDDDGNTTVPPKLISDAQRKRLFAIAKEHNLDEAQLRDVVYGVTRDKTGSTKTIPSDKYDQIIEIIRADEVPF
jgi:ERF superfamily